MNRATAKACVAFLKIIAVPFPEGHAAIASASEDAAEQLNSPKPKKRARRHKPSVAIEALPAGDDEFEQLLFEDKMRRLDVSARDRVAVQLVVAGYDSDSLAAYFSVSVKTANKIKMRALRRVVAAYRAS